MASRQPSAATTAIVVIVVVVLMVLLQYGREEHQLVASGSASVAQATQKGKRVHPKRIFWCGFPVFLGKKNYSLIEALFPDVQTVLNYNNTLPLALTEHDLLFVSAGGPCPYRPPELYHHIPSTPILFFFGNSKAIPVYNQNLYTLGPNRVVGGGGSIDRRQVAHSIPTTYAALHLVTFPLSIQQTIYDPSQRVRNTKELYLLYVSSHCALHRDEAFVKLASIGLVHYGGACKGNLVDEGKIDHSNITKAPVNAGPKNEWSSNLRLYGKYRFGLVMESAAAPGYISEKIINAWLGGTVPIYYGSTEVFDLFNPAAFVFYDLDHPERALTQVAALEANPALYEKMLQEPILRNGTDTIEKYFSFQDAVGGGKLKWKLRTLMGYV